MILNRIEKKIVEGFAKKQRPRNMISVGPFNMVIRDHGITIIPLMHLKPGPAAVQEWVKIILE